MSNPKQKSKKENETMNTETTEKTKKQRVDFEAEHARLMEAYGSSPAFAKFDSALRELSGKRDAYKAAKKDLMVNYRALRKVERLLSGTVAPRKPRKAKETK